MSETIEIDDPPQWLTALESYTEKFQPGWVAIRRYLHQNPELSGREHLTTEFLATELGKLDLPIHVAG